MAAKNRYPSLVSAARAARRNAYSPYSGVKIGAAVLTSGGKIFSGCNVENASYGLSCCAERTAIFSAVAQGARKIQAIAVAGKSDEFTRPCGACRQVMVEFNPSMLVLRRGDDGFAEDVKAEDLLPRHFNPAELADK
jgi:cytidine deaminase